MRYLVLLLIVCSAAFKASAATDSIPNGNPLNYQKDWQRWSKQVMADSGFATLFIDTTARPKYPMLGIATYDSSIWWFNMVKWQRVASPTGLYVRFSDSNTVFITPTQQADSLLDYVNRYSSQTIPITAPKTWNSLQTFNDSVDISSVLKMTIPRASIDRWGHTDSVQNIDPDGVVILSDRINNLNSVASKTKSPGSLFTVRHQLLLDKQQDTLNLKSFTASALNITTNFRRNSSSNDTVNVIGAVSTFPLKAMSVGLEETSDTSLIPHIYPYFNIGLDYSALYTYAAMSNHGILRSFRDLDIGNTTYLDDNSDSANSITNRYGLYINPLASNPINTNSYAIYQRGGTDTVYFHSADIKLDNLKTSLTPAFYVLQDANGNVLKKAYLPPVTATLDFPSTSAQTSSDLTVTVTGAAVGDIATVSWGNAPDEANSTYTARVSASNTVSVRFNNYSAGSINPTSGSFTVLVTPQ